VNKFTSLRQILSEFFNLKKINLPSKFSESIVNGEATLSSYLWTTGFCSRIRLCELRVSNKFYAESLVIYPDLYYKTPIFGTEYLKIGDKKYFGAIDFHPVSESIEYLKFLEAFPDKKVTDSCFYNLDQFFSPKLWLHKRQVNFYNEYQIMVKCFLYQYQKCLLSSEKVTQSHQHNHMQYNKHMAANDPAFGILKSYFGKDFAEEYIHNFLFSNK
jgi:15,16-dihydrobiliverdin:ferredoxin oxidoreductase